MKTDYIIITNNPLTFESLKEKKNIEYINGSYEDVLKKVRDEVHKGAKLLSHPLSGSLKPKETPYKSIMISTKYSGLDEQSLSMIESALLSCDKFQDKRGEYNEKVYRDFQLIDFDLISSAIASADRL